MSDGDCRHANLTGAGGDYHHRAGEVYRVEKLYCDDCDQTIRQVYKQVVEADSEKAPSDSAAIGLARNG